MSEYEKLAEQLGDIAVELHGNDYRTMFDAKHALLSQQAEIARLNARVAELEATSTLKPCPKCGSEFVSVDHGDFDDGNVCEFVRCDDCEYEVKRRFAGNGVAYWNGLSRAKMPSAEGDQS